MNNTTSVTNATIPRQVQGATLAVLALSGTGLIENGFIVVLLFMRSKLRKKPHVLFILCLSCIDFLISLNVLVLTSAYFTPLVTSPVFCGSMLTTAVITFGMSVIQAFIIAIERCYAVDTSSKYANHFSGRKKYMYMMISFIAVSLYSIILVIAFPPKKNPDTCHEDFLFDYPNNIIITITTQGLFVPVTVATLVVYTVAALKLRKRIQLVGTMSTNLNKTKIFVAGTSATSSDRESRLPTQLMETPSTVSHIPSTSVQQSVGSEETTITKRNKSREPRHIHSEKASVHNLIKALKTVALIEGFLFISFVPNAVVKLLSLTDIEASAVTAITRILPVLHPVINPILYLWCVPEFRRELKCWKW